MRRLPNLLIASLALGTSASCVAIDVNLANNQNLSNNSILSSISTIEPFTYEASKSQFNAADTSDEIKSQTFRWLGNSDSAQWDIKSDKMFKENDLNSYVSGNNNQFDNSSALLLNSDPFENLSIKQTEKQQLGFKVKGQDYFASMKYQEQAKVSMFKKDTTVDNSVEANLGYRLNTNQGDVQLQFNYAKASNNTTDFKTPFRFNSAEQFAASITWNLQDTGFHLAGLFYMQNADLNGSADGFNDHGYDLLAGYNFDNGLDLLVGYGYFQSNVDYKNKNSVTTEETRIPVQVNYAVNDNLDVWTKATFINKISSKTNDKDSQTHLSAGARYTF